MNSKREVFISIDVETAGPIPGEYSLLTIGACGVDDPSQTFACELKPTTLNADPKALEVTGLSPFDWSFVNYYFHRYLGENPFGFAALDIKSMYMGATGCKWTDTRSSRIAEALNPKREGDHDALHDALYQAELFRLTRKLM
jgi:DNA polymerase III epsilon subunit-like protein